MQGNKPFFCFFCFVVVWIKCKVIVSGKAVIYTFNFLHCTQTLMKNKNIKNTAEKLRPGANLACSAFVFKLKKHCIGKGIMKCV